MRNLVRVIGSSLTEIHVRCLFSASLIIITVTLKLRKED